MSNQEQGQAAQERPIANCDQECWVKARIATAIRMALDLKRNRFVCADDPIFKSAISGVVNGAAVEIIHTLGMETKYVNLINPYLSEGLGNNDGLMAKPG